MNRALSGLPRGAVIVFSMMQISSVISLHLLHSQTVENPSLCAYPELLPGHGRQSFLVDPFRDRPLPTRRAQKHHYRDARGCIIYHLPLPLTILKSLVGPILQRSILYALPFKKATDVIERGESRLTSTFGAAPSKAYPVLFLLQAMSLLPLAWYSQAGSKSPPLPGLPLSFHP